jgi:hypothetical protein
MDFSNMAALSQKINSMTLSLQKSETKIKFKKKAESENKTERQRLIDSLQKQIEDQKKNNSLSAIDTKLRSGKVLTADELSYLKKNNPELYQKAVEAKREREQYKNELKSCKTKDDVQRLRAAKLLNFAAEVSAIANNPNIPDGKKYELMMQINQRVEGINEAHSEFIRSGEYSYLPTDAEVLAEAHENNHAEEVEILDKPVETDEPEEIPTDIQSPVSDAEAAEVKTAGGVKSEYEIDLPEGGARKARPKPSAVRAEKRDREVKQWQAVLRTYIKSQRPAFKTTDFSGIIFNKKA